VIIVGNSAYLLDRYASLRQISKFMFYSGKFTKEEDIVFLEGIFDNRHN